MTDKFKEIDIQALLAAGLHFGHQTKRWNPKMKRFIFGEHNKIYIIDLEKTVAFLKEARQFLYDTVVHGREVLFVGTKKQAQESLRKCAESLGQFYVTNRWLGGMLTNNETIRKSVKRMRELEAMEKNGAFESMPKKEVSSLRWELGKLQKNLSGVADMKSLPGAVFIVDVQRESIAVSEAKKLGIPVVALVDTNADPDNVDYPIPGNDDSIRSVQVVVDILAEAVQSGRDEYSKIAAEEARRREAAEAESRARAKVEADERRAKEEVAKRERAEAIAKAKAAKLAKKKAEAETTVEAEKTDVQEPGSTEQTTEVASAPVG